MAKRFQNEIELFVAGDKIKFTFGVLVCTILASFSLVIAAFTAINISHYYIPIDAIFHPITFGNTVHTPSDFVAKIIYVPQVPMVAGMTVILGKKYSIIAILLYIIAGLFFLPVFSLGGGIKYITQWGFGYVLGFVPMVLFLATYLRKDFKPLNVIKASFLGVLALHVFGMLYLILIAAIRHEPFTYTQDLLHMMTFVKFIYDLIFTILSVYVANVIRKILWLAMD